MTLRAEMPHFRAMCRDGSCWMLAVHERARFRADWMAGKPFFTGIDAFDAEVDVKLADITGLSLWTAARIALDADENTERKSREMTEGAA